MAEQMRATLRMTLITFIVFQGEVRIDWLLARQGKGEALSIGKVILVHCCDRLDHLLSQEVA